MYQRRGSALYEGMGNYDLVVQARSLNLAVAKEIEGARRWAGMTQQQLADATGLSRATIIRYEDGKGIKLDELEKIALALGEDPMTLLQRAAARVKRED